MAWYRAGTVALTNGSATVTGTGTAFIANAQIGEGFLGPDGRTYEITNIASDTSLTISPAYLGSTASGQAYAIAPLRGRIADLIAETSNLLATFASVRDGIGAGLFPDGTVSLPALRFAADQDTGLVRIGSNAMALVCGGTTSAIIEANAFTVPSYFATRGSGTGTASFEHGIGRTGDGVALIDLHSSAGQDFNARFSRGAGANGNLEFINTGSGVFGFTQSGAGSFQFNSDGALRLQVATTALLPGSDNAFTLGLGSLRWSTVFATTGPINTSDAREKHWRGGPDEAALRAANRIIGELGFFQWQDAVDEKGEDRARIHFGVRAQQVMQIMAEEGLEDEQMLDLDADVFIPAADRPSFRHAFLCFDTWDDEFQPEMADVEVPVEDPTALIGEDGNPIMRVRMRKEPRPTGKMIQTRHAGNRFGLRIDQLTMFLLAALASRVAALESKKR